VEYQEVAYLWDLHHFQSYVELDVGTITHSGSHLRVEWAALDEPMGDSLVLAEVDGHHQLQGIKESFAIKLRCLRNTLLSIAKFLIIRWKVCLRMSLVSMV